jgi:prevent-host-death family protein
MIRMTATEAGRAFSDLLDRVVAGEALEITRGGVPVAVIGPARARFAAAERVRDLLASLPPVDKDFVRDLEEIRTGSGLPPESPWPS